MGGGFNNLPRVVRAAFYDEARYIGSIAFVCISPRVHGNECADAEVVYAGVHLW